MLPKLNKDPILWVILALLPVSFGIFQLAGGGHGGNAFTRDCFNFFFVDVAILFFYVLIRLLFYRRLENAAAKSGKSGKTRKTTIILISAVVLALGLVAVLILSLWFLSGVG